MWQEKALTYETMLAKVGKCAFEEGEKRAAKNTYSAERFICLQKINHLRIQEDGEERCLNDNERFILLDLVHQENKLNYEKVRKILNLSGKAIFKGVHYRIGDEKKAEKVTFLEMKGYHQIRNALKKDLKKEWVEIKNNTALLDEIGTVFSLCESKEEVIKHIGDKLSPVVLNALYEGVNFDKFIHISLKALHNILPLMEQGLSYTEAYMQVYRKKSAENHRLLPQIPADEIRNPVVLRTLTQARKVINGVVRLYGSPARIHIETGREVGKSYDERDKIKKSQDKNRKRNERLLETFKENYPDLAGKVTPKDILKLRLCEEQQYRCLYSGKPLDPYLLFENNYVQVDHALPLSRSWDDSYNNKVLVLTNENQNKRELTPFEWLDGKNNSEHWRKFKALVELSTFSYNKKQHLLTQKLDEQSFRKRNLNDNRYIARFLCKFIEENMLLTDKEKHKIFASNGQITALLRRRWGLAKSREDNDRHHALDAVVVACSTVAMQQKITRFVRYEAGNVFTGERIDYETGEIIPLHFPKPWAFFNQEVEIRIFSENPKLELENRLPDRPEANHEFVQPLFVSRMPTRKMTGQGHKETIKSAKRLEEGVSVLKVPLTQLKLADLERMVNREREKALYEALKARLEQFNNDPTKAFAEPFVKKGGEVVKAIRVEQVQKSGVLVRDGHGVADNASMVRVDVFTKGGKYFLVPIYTWQVAKGILPNKAATQYKDEDDWEVMDETAVFQFSLYQNDLVKLVTKKKTIVGYFNGLDRSTGNIEIKEHDLDKNKGKDGVHRGLGIKLALSFEKYQVDELGKNIRLCKPSKRQFVR